MDVIDYKKKPKSIRVKEINKLKLENFVVDESGRRPVAISLVIPTFNRQDREYNKTVLNIIEECGTLIDTGVIDEVVIAEGSRTEDNQSDTDFIEFLLAGAVRNCRTFEREVDFIRAMPEGKMKALQGRYDFSFRILNQLDSELHQIYLRHQILNQDEVDFLKRGKGANLWFSVPVTYGDIICFMDSDIKSFKNFYVKNLCRPILTSWKSGAGIGEDSSDILFAKATYIRRHKIPSGFTLGGRLSRLMAIPFFHVLAKHRIFNGLDSLSYPFSGECAITRKKLNELQFSNSYDIEISMLCQFWKKYSMDKISQTDLGFFRHMPGSDEHVEQMLEEISMAFFYWIKKYGLGKGLNVDKLLDEYEKAAIKTLPLYQKVARENPSKIRYSENELEADKKRISRYREIIGKGYERSKREKPKLLRPWSEIIYQLNSARGYSYQNLKRDLQERVNKFTSNMILSYIRIYIDRSETIIKKFTE